MQLLNPKVNKPITDLRGYFLVQTQATHDGTGQIDSVRRTYANLDGSWIVYQYLYDTMTGWNMGHDKRWMKHLFVETGFMLSNRTEIEVVEPNR